MKKLDRIHKIAKEAEQLISSGHHEGAFNLYINLLRTNAENYSLQYLALKLSIHLKKMDYLESKLANKKILFNLNSEQFFELGNLSLNQNLINLAIKLYEISLHKKDNIHCRYNLSICYGALEKNEEEDLLNRIIGEDEFYIDAYFRLASYYEKNNNSKCFELIKLIVQKFYNVTKAINFCAEFFIRQNQYDQAKAVLIKFLDYRDDDVHSHINLALVYMHNEKYDKAITYLKKAIGLSDKNIANATISYINLAFCYAKKNVYQDAETCLKKAIELDPNNFQAYYNLGNLYEKVQKYREAIDFFSVAHRVDNSNFWPIFNRGNCYKELGLFELAIKDYETCSVYNEFKIDAEFNKSMIYLTLGDLKRGLPGYELRSSKSDPVVVKRLNIPIWDGNAYIQGRRILVHFEQGLGDTIQFVRYLKCLEDKGAVITFAGQAKLRRLLSSFECNFEFIDFIESENSYDYQVSLLSLPFVLANELHSIPSFVPYLSAESERLSKWKDIIGGHDFKVGIAWQGNTGPIDKGRSFPLSMFENISKIEGVRLISLQKGEGENQIGQQRRDFSLQVLNHDIDLEHAAFIDTAAIISNLDLVITSDTSIAHLAGALGVKVWVVLKCLPDWRWFMYRIDTPWYPNMRLFRQQIPGAWEKPFEQVLDALKIEILKPK